MNNFLLLLIIIKKDEGHEFFKKFMNAKHAKIESDFI